MSFEPINENHSILEVTLAVQVMPEFTAEEIQVIESAHDQWKDHLPEVSNWQIFSVQISSDETSRNEPPLPVSFIRNSSDGYLEWELSIQFDMIVIRCLSYTRWNEIWGKTRKLFGKVCDSLNGKPHNINSISLQYTDLFTWTGSNDEYKISDVLDKNSVNIPSGIFNHGPRWHLHQGWITEQETPISGEILRRMHISGFQKNAKCLVKFESLEKFMIANSDSLNIKHAFSENSNEVDQIFEELHELNKSSLRDYLHSELQHKIKLNMD